MCAIELDKLCERQICSRIRRVIDSAPSVSLMCFCTSEHSNFHSYTTFCFCLFGQNAVVTHRLGKWWITEMNLFHCSMKFSKQRVVGEDVSPWHTDTHTHTHNSFPLSISGVTDRCSSLFIWSGFNNMKATARSGACCCLCGPLAVSWPLVEQREEAEKSQSCRLYQDEAKWKHGNLSDRYGGAEAPNGNVLPPFPAKTRDSHWHLSSFFDVIWCLRSKWKQPCKWHHWLRVTFVAEKAAEGSREFLGQAHNVETLTTANMRPVSDLRTAVGDREHESNAVPLCPACFSDKTNEHTRLKDPVRACGQSLWVVWGSTECKWQFTQVTLGP